MPVPLRIAALVVALVLFTGAAVLGYIAVIAFRRDEGVYVPAAYVAAGCLVGGVLLGKVALRG